MEYSELLKEKISRGFTPCFNDGCTLHEHCKRWQGKDYVSTKPLVTSSVNLTNPHVGGKDCIMFSADERVHMAHGFIGLLNLMPRGAGKKLMDCIIAAYCRTYAYEFRNGTRPITPQMQEEITAVCRHLGWQQPVEFDSYSDEYEW